MHSLPLRCCCIYLTIAALAHAAGQQDRFTPASFIDDGRSLLNLIRFPDTEGDVSVLVRCDTYVSRGGSVGTLYCFHDPKDHSIGPYLRSVKRAFRRTRLNPAEVNGRRVEVYFQFSVLFERVQGRERIAVFQGHLYEQEQPGVTYTAPQRYKDSRRWWGCRNDTFLWISMTVDERGLPSDAEVVAGDARDRCKSMLLEYAEAGRFIPATRDGAPVATTYVECFWTSDKERPVRRGRLKKKSDAE